MLRDGKVALPRTAGTQMSTELDEQLADKCFFCSQVAYRIDRDTCFVYSIMITARDHGPLSVTERHACAPAQREARDDSVLFPYSQRTHHSRRRWLASAKHRVCESR